MRTEKENIINMAKTLQFIYEKDIQHDGVPGVEALFVKRAMGVGSDLVSNPDYRNLIRLADGLGPWNAELAEYFEGGTDYSHIRDSSPGAMHDMANYLVGIFP